METHEAAAFVIDGVAFVGEPFPDRGDIGFARAEAALELGRLEESMVTGRGGILLLGEELIQLGTIAQREADLHRKLAGALDGANRGIAVGGNGMIAGQMHGFAVAERREGG